MPSYFTSTTKAFQKQYKNWHREKCFDDEDTEPGVFEWIHILRNKWTHAHENDMPEDFYSQFCDDGASHNANSEKFLKVFVSDYHPHMLVHLYDFFKDKNVSALAQYYPEKNDTPPKNCINFNQALDTSCSISVYEIIKVIDETREDDIGKRHWHYFKLGLSINNFIIRFFFDSLKII